MDERHLHHAILKAPITSLEVSPEFVDMCAQNNFDNLGEIILTPMHEFIQLPGAGYRMVKELGNVLNKHGLEHLLE